MIDVGTFTMEDVFWLTMAVICVGIVLWIWFGKKPNGFWE